MCASTSPLTAKRQYAARLLSIWWSQGWVRTKRLGNEVGLIICHTSINVIILGICAWMLKCYRMTGIIIERSSYHGAEAYNNTISNPSSATSMFRKKCKRRKLLNGGCWFADRWTNGQLTFYSQYWEICGSTLQISWLVCDGLPRQWASHLSCA